MKSDERRPVDRRLSMVYRVGAGTMGGALFVFGTPHDDPYRRDRHPSPARMGDSTAARTEDDG